MKCLVEQQDQNSISHTDLETGDELSELTSLTEHTPFLSSLVFLDITDTMIYQLPPNIAGRMPHLLILPQLPKQQEQPDD
jgi:hypothetical protein